MWDNFRLYIDNDNRPDAPLRVGFVDNIELLANRQKSSDRLLMCGHCLHTWIDAVPDSFPLNRFPCDNCEATGHVTQGMNRTDNEI